jgi:hypothetical protein
MRFRAAILAACLLPWATPAFSQACSMCYSTAKATSEDGQRAISRGVIVLLVPPLGFMTLGVWMAFRYGRKRDREQTDHVNSELCQVEESRIREVKSTTGKIMSPLFASAGQRKLPAVSTGEPPR